LVRENAISSIEKSLESGKHPLTGKIIKDKNLLEKDIKKVISKSELEVRGEIVKKIKKERAPDPAPEPVKEPEPIPVPETPVQPSLAAQVSGVVPPIPPVHRPPPCLGGGGCNQKPNRFVHDKVRGNICDAVGAPINQLPGNMCPFDKKLADKGNTGFHAASQPETGEQLVSSSMTDAQRRKAELEITEQRAESLLERMTVNRQTAIRQYIQDHHVPSVAEFLTNAIDELLNKKV
jgi:hypothetical protein